MAYDDYLADRIRRQLKDKHIAFDELKMMGGLCFKVDNKMLCGIHIDMNLKKPECLPMDFTGCPMKGYIYVTSAGFDTENELSYWIDLCLDFNPLAKASKPKKKVK